MGLSVLSKLVTAALLLCASQCSACVGTPEVTRGAWVAARPIDRKLAFGKSAVQSHFDQQVPIADYRSNTASTFSCVDSRGTEDQLGAFGGDFGELAAAIALYLNLTGAPGAQGLDGDVRAIFRAFMEDVASPDRPFYFHTSDEKLRSVAKAIGGAGAKPTGRAVLPDVMPRDDKSRKAWLRALSEGKNQGCGHVRLMIEKPGKYGLSSAAVPQALIQAFFEYWWPTPVGSRERSKVSFVSKAGDLEGRAIAIIDAQGSCQGQSPALSPSAGGSQVFIFHPQAVSDFRTRVLSPWFVRYHSRVAGGKGAAFDENTFNLALDSLQGGQLRATLKDLPPANALPQWIVTVTAREEQQGAVAALAAPLSAVTGFFSALAGDPPRPQGRLGFYYAGPGPDSRGQERAFYWGATFNRRKMMRIAAKIDGKG